MLTLQQLKDMAPETVFAQGEVANSEHGIFMERNNEGRMLKWVAVRGGIHDWGVYVLWSNNSTFEDVVDHGDKISSPKYIKSLVPCDDEAFNWYRL